MYTLLYIYDICGMFRVVLRHFHGDNNGKAIPLQAWTGPEGCRRLRLPRFQDNRHMKVVRLSAIRTGRLYPSGNTPGSHFCWRLSQPHGHSAAGRIMSMENSGDTNGNRTRDLPASSAMPQPTAPLFMEIGKYKYINILLYLFT